MRLSSLIRKGVFSNLPARAGIPPTWDRPDPPDHVRTPRTRRATFQDQHASFLSSSSPQFMIVNPEAGLGDFGQAFPVTAKAFGQLILFAFGIGSLGYLFFSQTQIFPTYNYFADVEAAQKERKWSESKYGLDDIKNNPWKLNSWPESFPVKNNAIQQTSDFLKRTTKSVSYVRNINAQSLSYYNRLYAQAQQKLKKKSSSHH